MIVYSATFTNGKRFYGVASKLSDRKTDHAILARKGSPFAFHQMMIRLKNETVTYAPAPSINLVRKFLIEINAPYDGSFPLELAEKHFYNTLGSVFNNESIIPKTKTLKTKTRIGNGVRARKRAWNLLYKQTVSDKIRNTKKEKYRQGAYPYFTPERGSAHAMLKVRGSRWFNDGRKSYRMGYHEGLLMGYRLGRLNFRPTKRRTTIRTETPDNQ